MSDLDKLLEEAKATAANVQFDTRICSKCEIEKPYSDFSFASQTKTDLAKGVRRKKAQCRACDSRETSAYYRRDGLEAARKRYREEYYSRKYGLDKALSKALSIAEVRTGRCPICKTTEKLVLDHDHATEKVRELICSSCNTLLGAAGDSLDVLYEAIAYIKRHRGL